MYLGIDVGGTKTLMAAFSSEGEILSQHKFATPENYDEFLSNLEVALKEFGAYTFTAGCCAIPGKVERSTGVGVSFGNLPWTTVPMLEDLKKLTNLDKFYLENDAKLAGLYEYAAMPGHHNLLYITIGTGVGIAVINGGQINLEVEDLGGAVFMVEENGQQKPWDDVSSGRALAAEYGKKASEIEDPKIWQKYVIGLANGLAKLINIYTPDAIVIGGGVGAHLEKFEQPLKQELVKSGSEVPPIIKAKRPEEAVIYGCYEYIKQQA